MARGRYWCKECGRKQVYCYKMGHLPTWLCEACEFEFRGSAVEVKNWELKKS